MPDGVVLTIIEGALPVFSFAGALTVVGRGRGWRRLAGVAGIAALAGALSPLMPGASVDMLVGLVAAVGFLTWVSPRAR